MTNELVLVLKTSEPIDWIVQDVTAVEKGTAMVISGSSTIGRTAISASGTHKAFAGVSRREKIANDGRTRLALFRESIFRAKSGDGLPMLNGDAVMFSGSNTIVAVKHSALSASAIMLGLKAGTLLEDCAVGETKEVWIGR